MGRGLAAILSVPSGGDRPRRTARGRVDAITPNPNQPRRALDESALAALAASLSERGVLQPVLVRPRGAGR